MSLPEVDLYFFPTIGVRLIYFFFYYTRTAAIFLLTYPSNLIQKPRIRIHVDTMSLSKKSKTAGK